ncbi:MAG: hypothetical protein QOE43_827 [Gaiellaceae bacterium]|jgi:hypothetical protein|nr:hypothetical protein [Gaiellaceae bacterium]
MNRPSAWLSWILWVAVVISTGLILGWLAAVLIGAASVIPGLLIRWRRRVS